MAHKVAQTNGTSEIAVAHRGKEVIVYGIGWVKTDKTMVEKTYATTLSHHITSHPSYRENLLEDTDGLLRPP